MSLPLNANPPVPATEQTWIVRSGEDIGRAIAAVRAHRGLTQKQLADEIGITREYVAKIEVGRSDSLLEHMLRALRRSGANVTITLPPDARTQST